MPTVTVVGTQNNEEIWQKIQQRMDDGNDTIILSYCTSTPVEVGEEEEPVEPNRSCFIVGMSSE